MSKYETKETKVTSGRSKPDHSSSWCSGKIYFTAEGCLYIDDRTLAAAIDEKAVANGGWICISYQVPGSEGNQMNLLCAC